MAIPAIMQQLARTNPMMGQIKQMASMVQLARDPQQAIRQLMARNPQMQQVMDVVNRYGGDPDRAFRETAAQMGVDPAEIMGMLR